MAIKKSDPPKKKLSQMGKLEAAMIKSGFYDPKAPPKYRAEITRTTKTAPNKEKISVGMGKSAPRYGAKITRTSVTIPSTAKKKAALKSMTSAQSEGISEAAQQKVNMALKKKPVSKK